jgi:hypothetical protein
MSTNVNPDILAACDYEGQFLQAQSNARRRIKMERGKMWLIRFLPAKLGPKGTWFARVAQHWLSMKPIICPRNTSPDFGGDPDADCPCCDVAAALNESPDPDVSKFGFKSFGQPQWLTYCVVFEKDGVAQMMREVLLPYEFAHYKSSFEELMAFYKAGLRRSPDSVFDYRMGNDFVVTRTGKGMKLDKQDSGPIFDLKEPNFKSYIEKIEAGIKLPKVTIPTNDQLYIFSQKIQEWADKLQGGEAPEGGARRRRTSAAPEEAEEGGEGGYQEHDDEPAAPVTRPRGTTASPARRPTSAPAAVDESTEAPPEDDSNPELNPEKPAPRRPAAAAAPAEVVEAPAPPVRRSVPAPATKLAPSPNRTRAVASEATAAPPEEVGEEEDLPEEATDQAPPADAPVEQADAGAPEPPAVTRRGGMGTQIKGKIDSLTKRGA